MMLLQYRPTTGNIILKEGAIVNLLIGSHRSSNKLSLGSLIPTVSPRIAKILDINPHIIVSSTLHPTILHSTMMKPSALSKEEKKDEDKNKEGSVSWWYNLLAQLVDIDNEEDEESEDESEEKDEDESAEEDGEDESAGKEDQTEEEEREDEEEVYNERTSFIATLFNNKEIKEEVPVKCEDPGPCLVTCRIKGVEVRECPCDPGACSSVMPYELYKFLKIGELLILADFYVIKSTKGEKGGTPQVLLGRPFLKTAGFKHIYYDEIFTFEVGNVIEIFHLAPPPKPRKKSLHQLQEREKKKISLNTEKKKKKKKEPDEGSTQEKRALKCLSFDGLLGKLTVLKNVLCHNENIDTHLIARTKSNPLAKGKTKAHRPPLQTSPRLVALQSRGKAQPQLQAPDVPTENIPMSILPPKKRLTYRMAGEGSSRKGTKLPCRRSQRIAALHHAEGALPAVEGGAKEILPKNDVDDALWAMPDAESENEAEEIPGQWDLDSVLNNWGKVEPNMGPDGNDQGPPPVAN
ncbi:hypothetical protein PIB30_073243 [Stylosanthes scabra]|uniref:Uncharacterized protein n=1 Tax=Stylosanthes scabra TaxID=79078 RepID=A0ABU6XPA9_9FABA|nr:hypothetical protein [Stylosanthes scabra]